MKVHSFAAYEAGKPLRSFEFSRRAIRPNDVLIDILYCGVCHSDLHSVRGEWGNKDFPLVPGHEIVGRVEAVGPNVKKWKIGENVGVGCFVDSCRKCSPCQEGLQQFCESSSTQTYGSVDRHADPQTVKAEIAAGVSPYTQGGYSTKIVVDADYVLRIPNEIPLDQAAPLLCAGITMYSPLKHWKVRSGQKVAVLGLGGLGHMAVKFAASFGAEVTVLSTSESKAKDAKRLGAHHFVVTTNPESLKSLTNKFDLILDSVSAAHDYNTYLRMLKRDGTMVLLGLPEPQKVAAGALIFGRHRLSGSLIGGIPETQEMLNYCAQHGITSDVEVIPMQKINESFERMLKGDVHYRFVIDLQSLK